MGGSRIDPQPLNNEQEKLGVLMGGSKIDPQLLNKSEQLIALILLICGILSWTFAFLAWVIQMGLHIDVIDGNCIYPTGVTPILAIIGAVIFLYTQIVVTITATHMIFGLQPPTVPHSNPKHYQQSAVFSIVMYVCFLVLYWFVSAVAIMLLTVGALRNQRLYHLLIDNECNAAPAEAYFFAVLYIAFGLGIDIYCYLVLRYHRYYTRNPHVAPVVSFSEPWGETSDYSIC